MISSNVFSGYRYMDIHYMDTLMPVFLVPCLINHPQLNGIPQKPFGKLMDVVGQELNGA